jgi:hypothetical protein
MEMNGGGAIQRGRGESEMLGRRGGSPWSSWRVQCLLGITGGDEFVRSGGGRSSGRWRPSARFTVNWIDSFDRRRQGDEAELLGALDELGGASIGGARRRLLRRWHGVHGEEEDDEIE